MSEFDAAVWILYVILAFYPKSGTNVYNIYKLSSAVKIYGVLAKSLLYLKSLI